MNKNDFSWIHRNNNTKRVWNTYGSFLLHLQLLQLLMESVQLVLLLLKAAEDKIFQAINATALILMLTRMKGGSNTYLSLRSSRSAAFTCWITNDKHPQGWLWCTVIRPFVKIQTDKECLTSLLPSSFLLWLASNNELMDATCCTSWLFSVWVSSSCAVRASTCAELSLISASNFPIRTWNSAGWMTTVNAQNSEKYYYSYCSFWFQFQPFILWPASVPLSCWDLFKVSCRLVFLLCIVLRSSHTSSNFFCNASSLSVWLACQGQWLK